jgi:hypothetical protein
VAILRARKGRRFFEVLKKMIPGMSHSLMPLLFFIVLVMVASYTIYDKTIHEFADPSYTSYNWFFLGMLLGFSHILLCHMPYYFIVF